jgi:hypothetical protein
MNFYNLQSNSGIMPKAYNPDTLEGNWYEDRCISQFDDKKKSDYKLNSAFNWQYETTYNEVGNFKKISPEKFSNSNDNYINFQGIDYNMYVTTTKHSLDPMYKETFRKPATVAGYFKDKDQELKSYRDNWTKRSQNFDTTYKTDILSKTASMIFSKK